MWSAQNSIPLDPVEGDTWYDTAGLTCYEFGRYGWRKITMTEYLKSVSESSTVSNRRVVPVNAITDWKTEYGLLKEEFENYKANVLADYELEVSDLMYKQLYDEVKASIIKDVEVEAFKKARELYILQVEEANSRV